MRCKLARLFAALLLSVAAYAQACSCAGQQRIEYFRYAPTASTPDQCQLKQVKELAYDLNGERIDYIILAGYAYRNNNKDQWDGALALKRAQQLRDAMAANGIPAKKIQIADTSAALPLEVTRQKFTNGVRVQISFVPDCACPSMQ